MTRDAMRRRREKLIGELDRVTEKKESLSLLADRMAKEIERLDIEIAVGELLAEADMHSTPTFQEEFSKLGLFHRRRFRRGSEAGQRDVIRQYERHRGMCEKHGVDVDPLFLREVITDMETEAVTV